MIYDHDYYVQGEKKYRLHRMLQPVISFLYWWRARATLAHCRFPLYVRGEYRALDVGAGRGEFLFCLRQRGWEVVGTQISKDAIEVARDIYHLALIETNLPLASELGKFDLITYWHTFEHIENGKDHLHQARSLLRGQESRLVMEVPNPESLGARICFNSWLGSDVQHHKNLVSHAVLCSMIREAGLEIVRAEAFSLKFTLVFLYSAVCGWLSRGVVDFDFLMEMLKRPFETLSSNWGKAFLWLLISPVALVVATFLIPIGIIWKRSETIRLYIKPAVCPE